MKRLYNSTKVNIESRYTHDSTNKTLVIYYDADKKSSSIHKPSTSFNNDWQSLVEALTCCSTGIRNYHSWVVL